MFLRRESGRYRYIKTRERDPEKRRILIDLALARIREVELTDFILVGPKRRRLKG
jgi:hypothetical protein